jgi:dTDP-4-amino-4,6-dideoxygalactose transaminase
MDISALVIRRTATIRDALEILDRQAVGILLLTRPDGTFERTITDGDLRRLLLGGATIGDTLGSLPEREAFIIAPGYTRRQALAVMQKENVNHLPVVDTNGRILDLVERTKVDEQILLSSPHMGEAELDYVAEAFRTNWIAPLGPNVDAFEREVAHLVGSKHAVALSSGTAAIHIALRLLGVEAGDLVFCSALTFVASANPILYQGAEPTFIDSDASSWNMSPSALERALEAAKRRHRLPKALIVVSLYGQCADMDPIVEICRRYGVPIIEDAAESLGASYRGRPAGTLGDFGIFSFNGNKIITTSGGGMLITDSEEQAERARFLSTQARDPAPHYQHSEVGYNYRMSNLLAGVGRGQLKVLGQRVEARRHVFERYRRELADIGWLEWMPEPDWSFSTHWLSACVVRPGAPITAQALVRHLSDEFIEARPIWKPMHLQPLFADAEYYPHGNSSVSDQLFERGLCLPSGSNMSESDLSRIIDAIRNIATASV